MVDYLSGNSRCGNQIGFLVLSRYSDTEAQTLVGHPGVGAVIRSFTNSTPAVFRNLTQLEEEGKSLRNR